jgi:hypothetical protein
MTVDKLFADGDYNDNDIFRYISDNGIMPYIKLKMNSIVQLKTGNFIRNLSVISQKKDLQKWEDGVICGHRCIVETVFSSIENVLRYVYYVKFKNMIQEMMLKVSWYNKFVSF